MNISELSVKQLKKALRIKEKIAKLENELAGIIGTSAETSGPAKKRKGMSAAGRRAIAAAQKRRWAKIKAEQKGKK